ncbi:uncharacterized protein LOC109838536 [Asparagus officinalis]|uniref:uncharacterized protein LOC109838536 n=1 Tax=Asparagus officinalis TaxID=4686 RepID=UPI00098DF9A3|nr:uncharacterized protein LOC109838536 [Asparagus officinalis]
MSKNINSRLFEANPSQDQSTEEEPPSSGEMSGEGEEEPTPVPLYADPPVILRAYIPGIERGPLPACAEGYRLKQTEKYMLAKKRLDEWGPQIDEILSDAKNEIRQRFGEKLYQKKGRQGSDFKKKLPPDGFRAIVRWGHNGIPTGQWANNFSSYLGCLIRRSDNVNPYYEAWEQPFHVLESIYREC